MHWFFLKHQKHKKLRISVYQGQSKLLSCADIGWKIFRWMKCAEIRRNRGRVSNSLTLFGQSNQKKCIKNWILFLGASVRALKTPVLNMTGDHSPHVEATVAFNGRLQPNKCTWMKIQVHIYQIFSILPSVNALVYWLLKMKGFKILIFLLRRCFIYQFSIKIYFWFCMPIRIKIYWQFTIIIITSGINM